MSGPQRPKITTLGQEQNSRLNLMNQPELDPHGVLALVTDPWRVTDQRV